MSQLTPQQFMMLAILAISFFLLLTEWIRNDVVGILIIVALYATG